MRGTGLQDGMLAYYLSQAGQSDVNVAARLEKEPFDYRTYKKPPEPRPPIFPAEWLTETTKK